MNAEIAVGTPVARYRAVKEWTSTSAWTEDYPRASRDFGAPFAEIFNRFHGDFYAIDPMLFSPAEVIVTAIDSGASFHAGAIHHKLLDASFS